MLSRAAKRGAREYAAPDQEAGLCMSNWGVATPHRTASEHAADALARGGNAVDAALAAAVVLTVVYPDQCSVGGDVIALVGTPDGGVVSIDGSGRAPLAADPDRFGSGMPVYGAHAITVPGAVAAWFEMSRRWGSLPLADPLRAASDLATAGVAVAPGLARALARETDRLRADPGLREVFLPDGDPLCAGETLLQPRLAGTLGALADSGPEAFYAGPAARSIVATLREHGSAMALEDFSTHRTSFGEPIATTYAGADHLTAPPGSQGAFFLEALAALEIVRAHLGRHPDPAGADAAVVAMVLDAAARDRDAMLGDPDSTTIDLDALLSTRAQAIGRDALARRGRGDATVAVKPSGDTVAVVVTDGRGGWVSLMQSNFHAFGSGILDPGTGVVLHNRGASFELRPDSPNRFTGGRRPAHTLMPVLVRERGELVGAHGTMGGRAQPQVHARIALHLARGATPEAAVSGPRWVLEPRKAGSDATAPGVVAVEEDLPLKGRGQLAEEFRVWLAPHDDEVGHAQVVRRTSGQIVAATDPQADGAALTG
jgi:gamma-glutamyltranspeptidase/glutathione hydrolase